MKIRIVGVLAGVLLIGGSIGYAAGTSLIGSKVTGVFSIEQNGVKIADAAIINGSAYVPVRIMANATGTQLTVEGKKIIMEGKAAAIGETTKAEVARVLTEDEKATFRKWIVSSEAAIVKYREVIAQTESELAAETDPTKIQGLKEFIADLESRIAGAQTTIEDAKTRLGE